MAFREDNRPLFRDGDLSVILHGRAEEVIAKVAAIPEDQFLATSEEQLVEYLISVLEVEPIELHESAMEMDKEETKVDVSHEADRNPFRDPGPIYVSGIRVTVTIPYTGDPELWRLRLHQFQMNYPRGNVRQPGPDGIGYLDIVIARPSDEGHDSIKGTSASKSEFHTVDPRATKGTNTTG